MIYRKIYPHFIWIKKIRSKLRFIDLWVVSDPLLYLGYTDRSNFGDDLLLELYKSISENDVVSCVDIPAFFIPKNAKLVLGGGTLINGDLYFRILSSSSNFVYLESFFSGVIGSNVTPEWSRELAKFDRLQLRSVESAERVKKMGLKAECKVDPGMLVGWKQGCIFGLKTFPKPLCKAHDLKKLIINMHFKGKLKKYFLENSWAYKRLRAEYQIAFFVASPEDLGCLDGISNWGDEVIYGFSDIKSSLIELAAADVVISERLHAGVCAASFGARVYAYRYEEKCSEFFQSVKLENAIYSDIKKLMNDVFDNKGGGRLSVKEVDALCSNLMEVYR